MLEKEYAYYNAHLAEFLKEHQGQFVVIQGEVVRGFYTNEAQAIESMKGQELGTYFVKLCLPPDQAVAEYHSRVVFSQT